MCTFFMLSCSEYFGENRVILLQTVAKRRCFKLFAIFSVHWNSRTHDGHVNLQLLIVRCGMSVDIEGRYERVFNMQHVRVLCVICVCVLVSLSTWRTLSSDKHQFIVCFVTATPSPESYFQDVSLPSHPSLPFPFPSLSPTPWDAANWCGECVSC